MATATTSMPLPPRTFDWGKPLVVLAAAAVTIGGCISPKYTAVAFVGLILAALVVRFPAFGVGALVSFFALQDSPFLPQLTSRGTTVSDLVAVLVLFGLVLQAMRDSRWPSVNFRGRGGVVFTAVCAFFGWSLITVLWSGVPSFALSNFVRTQVEAPILLFLTMLSLDTMRRVRIAAAMYAITGLGISAWVISHYTSVQALTYGGPGQTASQLTFRGGAISYNPNELGLMLAVVPAFTYLAIETWPAKARVLITLASIPLVGFALLVLTSRTSLIALGAALLAAILFARGGGRVRAGLAALVAVAAALYGILLETGGLPPYFLQRFQQIGSDQLSGRGPVWTLALNLFEAHPFGLGAYAFEQLLPSSFVVLYAGLNSAHSDFIGALVDYGIIGELLLLAMIAVLLWTAILHGSRRHPAVIIIVVTLIGGTVSNTLLSSHWFWALMSVVTCYALVTESTNLQAEST